MKIILTLIYTISFHILALSEPTPLVTKLMNESASMFDIGLDRIDRNLKNYSDTSEYSASYDWKKNTILISHTDSYLYTTEKGYSKACDKVQSCIDFTKDKFLQETSTLCISLDDEKNNCDLLDITQHFNHRGYELGNFYNGKDMSDAITELHNITMLRLTYLGKNMHITCEKLLTEKSAKCFQK